MKILKILLLSFLFYSCSSNNDNLNFREIGIIKGNLADSLLIYSSWDKKVVIENPYSRKILFEKEVQEISMVEPQLYSEHIYFTENKNELQCYDFENDVLLWKLKTDNRIQNFTIINENIGLLDVENKGIFGINILNGKEIYHINHPSESDCVLPRLSPYPISFDANNFYINNWECTNIAAYNKFNGQFLWSKKFSDGLAISTILKPHEIFLGINNAYEDGILYVLDSKYGEIKKQHVLGFQERRIPLTYKNRMIFYTYDDRSLKTYDVLNNQVETIMNFNSTNDIVGQLFLVNDFLYFQDSNFDIIKLDLNSLKSETIGKSRRGGISEIYIKDGKEVIVY